MDRRDANMKVLSEAEATQVKTLESIERMKRQAASTEEVGAATLEQLRSQGNQMDDLSGELVGLNVKIEKTKKLQSTFDAWAGRTPLYVWRLYNNHEFILLYWLGNWGGWKRNAADKEANNYIAMNKDNKLLMVKDVYEQQKYNSLSRKWNHFNYVLFANTSTEVSVPFDPSSAAVTKGSKQAQ
jgi:hypothetical protein